MVGAELPSQSFLVATTGDCNCPKSKLYGKLNAEMAKAPDTKDGNGFAATSGTVSERVECRDPRTKKWRRLRGLKIVGNEGKSLNRRNHVLCISTVDIDPGYLQVRAIHKITAATC
jgi:hypothetical protein